MRSTILSMIDSEVAGLQDACDLVIKHTISRMESSFQPFFDAQYDSSESMGSSLDYLLRIGTQRSPTEDLCTNFQVHTTSAPPSSGTIDLVAAHMYTYTPIDMATNIAMVDAWYHSSSGFMPTCLARRLLLPSLRSLYGKNAKLNLTQMKNKTTPLRLPSLCDI